MRTALLALALLGFVGLAVTDLAHGDVRRGCAELLIVAANALLLR